MSKVQPLRGMKDLYGQDYLIHEYIIDRAKNLAKVYGYEGLSVPIVEQVSVFDRSLGQTSDVISKEIYSFLDKSGNSIALRPEFTAGVVRSFISNGMQDSLPVKLFSYGPLFRYDRPQSGRQRQFHQLNFEHIGAARPHHDAEIINLAQELLEILEVVKDCTLEINSLGCFKSRELYAKKLFEYFESFKDKLSEDSLARLYKNPLRILDSKDEGDKKVAGNAPLMNETYTSESKEYFEEVIKYLDILKIKYVVNSKLVRGLDYYCHTAFEYTTSKLGAQSSVLGGGRYDGLVESMGGAKVPAIGFAAGIERIKLMRDFHIQKNSPVVIMPLDDNDLGESLKLATALRNSNIACIIMDKGKIDKRLSKALNTNTNFVIFIGESERALNNYKIKNLNTREEKSLSIEDVIKTLSIYRPTA